MGVFSPDFWNDVGVVAILIIGGLGLGLSFKQGWIVTGFTYKATLERHAETVAVLTERHTETVEVWKLANNQLRDRSGEDQKTIQLQAETITKSNVAGELSAHVLAAIQEATSRVTP